MSEVTGSTVLKIFFLRKVIKIHSCVHSIFKGDLQYRFKNKLQHKIAFKCHHNRKIRKEKQLFQIDNP